MMKNVKFRDNLCLYTLLIIFFIDNFYLCIVTFNFDYVLYSNDVSYSDESRKAAVLSRNLSPRSIVMLYLDANFRYKSRNSPGWIWVRMYISLAVIDSRS